MLQDRFEGFDYAAHEVSKYIYSSVLGLFTIVIKGQSKTINFMPNNPEAFHAWLVSHKVQDIKGS